MCYALEHSFVTSLQSKPFLILLLLKVLCWYSPSVSVGLPDDSGCDLSTEKDAQVADCVGGEHADDGKCDGELLI